MNRQVVDGACAAFLVRIYVILVLATVLGDIDKDDLIGKTITFEGAFTIRTFNLIQIDVKQISIVPVEIKLGE